MTRAEASDGPLCSQLRSLGVKVLLWPAIEVTKSDSSELDAALARGPVTLAELCSAADGALDPSGVQQS